MRAVAALAVVLLHSYQIYGMDLVDAPAIEPFLSTPIGAFITSSYMLTRFGHYAVEVFLVLSGFSLMLPVARSHDERLSGGTLEFYRRRFRRILPPYYAALAFALLLIVLVPGMNALSGAYWDVALPALEAGPILSHLFLVHNINREWLLAINPPMWSIAVEWQIYFLFPLMVAIWRMWGSAAIWILTTTLGVMQLFVLPLTYPFSDSWFLVLFVTGIIGASISFSRRPSEIWLRERLPWNWLALGFTVAMFGFGVVENALNLGSFANWIKDILLGLGVTSLLVYLAKQGSCNERRPSLMLRLFQLPALVHIGRFSYSVYLLHAPIIALMALVLRSAGVPLDIANLAVILMGIPLVTSMSYGFFILFERPFMSKHARSTESKMMHRPTQGVVT